MSDRHQPVDIRRHPDALAHDLQRQQYERSLIARVQYAAGLTPTQRIVTNKLINEMSYLVGSCTSTDGFYPVSVTGIAESASVSHDTVSSTVQLLERHGVLERRVERTYNHKERAPDSTLFVRWPGTTKERLESVLSAVDGPRPPRKRPKRTDDIIDAEFRPAEPSDEDHVTLSGRGAGEGVSAAADLSIIDAEFRVVTVPSLIDGGLNTEPPGDSYENRHSLVGGEALPQTGNDPTSSTDGPARPGLPRATDRSGLPEPGRVRLIQGNIPAEVRVIDHWVGWRYEHKHLSVSNKPKKVPINPRTGKRAKSNWPSTWGTLHDALICGEKGIGFQLTAEDPYVAIDLDNCRDPQTGVISGWAQEVIDWLASYTEVSPSGTGIHIIVRAQLPPGGRRRGDIEMYDRSRYMTITGELVPGAVTTIQERSDDVAALHEKVFGAASRRPGTSHSLSAERAVQILDSARRPPRLEDELVLRNALRASNAAKFKRLWEGDTSGYASESNADAALCRMLAYWTDSNPDQMDRLFRRSKLFRAKWDSRRGAISYGGLTIASAIGYQQGRSTSAPQHGERVRRTGSRVA